MKIAIVAHLLHVSEDRVFATARELGFDGVELSVGAYGFEEHAILKPGGPSRLRVLADTPGVAIPSLSAGCFSRISLLGEDRDKPRAALQALASACGEAGVPLLHLPLYGVSDVHNAAELRRLGERLDDWLSDPTARNVKVALDGLLPAAEVRSFVERFGGSVGISYDVGNARAAGRDVAAEIPLLGPALLQIRVKDRERREPFASVPLGEGAVHWQDFARTLSGTGYAGWLVLDTPSGDNALASVRRNRDFLASLFSETRAALAS